MKARCLQAAPDVSCANYRWLSALKAEQVKQMPDDQLRVLEQTWDNIDKGVL